MSVILEFGVSYCPKKIFFVLKEPGYSRGVNMRIGQGQFQEYYEIFSFDCKFEGKGRHFTPKTAKFVKMRLSATAKLRGHDLCTLSVNSTRPGM